MTSLVDLLRDAERNKVGVNGNVTLATPKELSREEKDLAIVYLSEFKPKTIRNLIKASDIKTILYTGNNPDDWYVMVKNSLLPFSICGYKPSAGRQKQAHSGASQAL